MEQPADTVAPSTLTIPPEFGFGAQGNAVIPPNTTIGRSRPIACLLVSRLR